MWRGSVGDYGSHYPVLAACVARAALLAKGTDRPDCPNPRYGDVLELGSGDFSTPMLHYLCRALGVSLVTMDTSLEWMSRFGDYHYVGPNGLHVFTHVRDWEHQQLDALDMKWGVVFVDCAPGEMRWKLIERLANHATFIVAHDSERDHGTGANYEYEKIRPLFKHVTEFRRFRPYTLILSNVEEFKVDPTDQTWEPPPHA